MIQLYQRLAQSKLGVKPTHMTRNKWLALIHQLPPTPDYLRVKTRRRLSRLGALALKNSVYLLPYTEACVEDFLWLRQEILSDGGEATVCEMNVIGGPSDAEIEAAFRAERDAEYEAIVRDARVLDEAKRERLRAQFDQVVRRDHFGGNARPAAQHALEPTDARLPTALHTWPHVARPAGATWVTRADVFVDRMACAWLIRRFIDDSAVFKFVRAKEYAHREGELRFDMFEGEFTHVGERCTFEVLQKTFGIEDAALSALGEVVHDIDCRDGKFGRSDVGWMTLMLQGVVRAHAEDGERLRASGAIFDAWYAAENTKASRGGEGP